MNKLMKQFITGTISVMSFCVCNSSFAQVHYVGEQYGGGTVFYVDCSRQHGLIAGPIDIGTNIVWGCKTNVYSTTAEVGDGPFNTAAIITRVTPTGCLPNSIPPGFAANLCNNYSGSGLTDWFLPSRKELELLIGQKDVIVGMPASVGNHVLWSSTEYNANNAWFIKYNVVMSGGLPRTTSITTGITSKLSTGSNSTTYHVWPVRAF